MEYISDTMLKECIDELKENKNTANNELKIKTGFLSPKTCEPVFFIKRYKTPQAAAPKNADIKFTLYAMLPNGIKIVKIFPNKT